MRISDWSSDVCSSDLHQQVGMIKHMQAARHGFSREAGGPQFSLCFQALKPLRGRQEAVAGLVLAIGMQQHGVEIVGAQPPQALARGRASGGEGAWNYV